MILKLASWLTAMIALCAISDTNVVHPVIALMAAGLVYLYSLPGQEESLLAKPVFVTLGLWSYSLYLTHRIFQHVWSAIGIESSQSYLLKLTVSAVTIGAALFMAFATYRFIEEPSRKLLLKRIR